MEKISQVMTWRKDEDLNGDVQLIGTLKVSSTSVIKYEVSSDDKVEAAAKRQGADMIHRRLYGEIQHRLFELERMLIMSLPGDFMESTGPLEKLREIQALIGDYK